MSKIEICIESVVISIKPTRTRDIQALVLFLYTKIKIKILKNNNSKVN